MTDRKIEAAMEAVRTNICAATVYIAGDTAVLSCEICGRSEQQQTAGKGFAPCGRELRPMALASWFEQPSFGSALPLTDEPTEAPLTVPEILRAGADTYEQRNKLYGDNYKQIGPVLRAIYPQGLPATMTDEDWNRFACWFQVLCKVIRYGVNMQRGGHKDSAHDSAVYSAMLEELTDA
jgi:hypothetical protein